MNDNKRLAAEFNYIAQTAFQANEDRARVSSFYMIAVGSPVAALLGGVTLYLQFVLYQWAFK